MSTLEEKQNQEKHFWRTCENENPASNSLENIINKVSDAGVLLSYFKKYGSELAKTGNILELGGGQGWASCVYKRLYPSAHITTTDISDDAVVSLPKWERLYEVKLDNSYACMSYETREKDSSIDQIFCFAAAHHFIAHRRTMRELSRILKPGGKIFYFHEPSTPKFLYRFAYWRVNKKRPDVHEDVLIPSKLKKIAREFGCELRVEYFPSTMKRGVFETIYYYTLGRLPFLQHTLPCTAAFIFTKKGA